MGLFDLEKATNLDGGETGARDFLADTFFSSFDKKRKDQANALKAGGKAMEKHNVEQKLKSLLADKQTQGDDGDWWRAVIEYMKTLSPSGVELEIMNLVSFDFSKEMQGNPNFYLVRFLKALELTIRSKTDSDFVQALLNCCLKNNYDVILEDEDLVSQIKEIQRTSNKSFDDLEDLLNHNIC